MHTGFQSWCARLRWLIGFAAVGLVACGGGGTPGPLPAVDTSAVAVASTASALPTGWQDGVFMEIFVRAYQDSDGDGIGDFNGLTQRLDYLQALGVQGIWLMPVFPSQDGDHGYAVKDYRAIAPEYGRMADFQAFVAAAHQRGIGVVLDYVVNHSAAQHPAFINALSGGGNAYADWYVWQDRAPGGWHIYEGDPWRWRGGRAYFAGFSSEMPDFHLRNPAVLGWHADNLRFWLNLGVDGFRFDAVGNLVENGPDAWENQPENHTIMADLGKVVHGYEQRFVVCEAPGQPQRFAQSDSCGSAFAFGYPSMLVDAVRGNASRLAEVAAYWAQAPEGMVGFASNHDRFAGARLADQLEGDLASGQLAAALYLLQSRRPFVYYGEEIGLRAPTQLSGDPALRTPMSWSAQNANAGFTSGVPFRHLAGNYLSANAAAQDGVEGSLLSHYRALIAMRRGLPALGNGQYRVLAQSGLAFAFERANADSAAVVAFNMDGHGAALSLSGLPPGARLVPQWNPLGPTLTVADDGQATAVLPARSFEAWRRLP